MAFPTIPTVAAGRVLTTTQANTTATRTFPSLSSLTKNSGDLLIAIIVGFQSSSVPAFSSWGGGFTEFADLGTATTQPIGAAYKWSNGAETGTFTVTQAATIQGHAAMFLLSIPGAHASTIPGGGSYASGTTSAADPASFDPSGWAAEDTLWIAVGASGEASTTGAYDGVSAAPTNYSNYVDSGISADVAGGVEAALGFRQLNASSENVGTFTVDLSNARNAAALIAVRPAPVNNFSQPADDSAASTDAQAKGVTAAKSDALAGTDSQSRTWAAQSAAGDSGVLADAQSKASGAVRADSGSITDSVSVQQGFIQGANDSGSLTDAHGKGVGTAAADSASATDATGFVFDAERVQADGAEAADALARGTASAQADVAAGTDAQSRALAKLVADAIEGSDSANPQLSGDGFLQGIDDSAAGADSAALGWTAERAPADSASVSDAVGKRITVSVADGLAVQDGIGRALGVRVFDTVLAGDQSARAAQITRELAESVFVADTRGGFSARTLTDALSVADGTSSRLATPPSRWPFGPSTPMWGAPAQTPQAPFHQPETPRSLYGFRHSR